MLMSASALFLGTMALATSFLPQELLAYFGGPASKVSVLAVKLLGGGYVGFAALNWMARGNLIGGIYSRPVAVGNFAQFFIGAVVLGKLLFNAYDGVLLVLALVYVAFAVSFGYLLFAGGVPSK